MNKKILLLAVGFLLALTLFSSGAVAETIDILTPKDSSICIDACGGDLSANWGTSNELREFSGGGNTWIFWVGFNLTELPQSVKDDPSLITNASLILTHNSFGGSGQVLAVYNSSIHTWTETGITGNNNPCGTSFSSPNSHCQFVMNMITGTSQSRIENSTSRLVDVVIDTLRNTSNTNYHISFRVQPNVSGVPERQFFSREGAGSNTTAIATLRIEHGLPSPLNSFSPQVNRTIFWGGLDSSLSTNISVVNSTPSASITRVTVEINGTNRTAVRIQDIAGGGIFNFNASGFFLPHGNHTIRQFYENGSLANFTNSSNYLTFQVLSGMNISVFNKNNGTAVSGFGIEVSNGSFTRLYQNLNNQVYIPYDQLPTGSAANLTVFRNGFRNFTTSITPNATHLNFTNIFISRLQEFRAIDNSTMTTISSFTLNATNGTFSTSTYSTSNGKILIPAEELPFGTNITFLVAATTYSSNTTNVSYINGSSELNVSFSLAVSRFAITVFDEITVQPVENFTIILNNGTFSSITPVTGATFISNTSILPVGATTVTVQHPNYVERNYFVTISPTSTLSLTAYLLNTTSGVFYNFIVITGTGNPIENARVTIQKNFNGTIIPVSQHDTDSSGTASFWMNLFTNYVVKVEKDGYVNAIFNQIPQTITSTTFVRLTATGATASINIGFNTAYSNVSILFLPRESFQNGSFVVQFTISDSAGALQRFGMNVSYMNQTNNSLILYDNQSVTGFPGGATLSFTVPNITGNWQVDAFFVKNDTQINLTPVYYTLFQQTGASRINFNFNQDGSPSRFAFLLVMTIIAALVAVFTARFSLDAAVFMPLVIFGIATALGIMVWYEFLMILLPTIAVYLLWRRPI